MDENQPAIKYNGFSVLVRTNNPPQEFFRPETTLQDSGVVPKEWQVVEQDRTRRNILELEYDSGLVVRRTARAIGFNLSVDPTTDLLPHIELSNRIVDRFLTTHPALSVKEFAIQCSGYTMMPDGSPGIRNIGLPLENVVPIISFHGGYDLRDRELEFHIRETSRDSDRINCLDFSVETNYFADDFEEPYNVEFWQLIAPSNKTWVLNCEDLVYNFYSAHITLD